MLGRKENIFESVSRLPGDSAVKSVKRIPIGTTFKKLLELRSAEDSDDSNDR